ncbi:MAG: DoxX family protein [Labrys sp. (in: a-proteobacteria)]|jgi:putative oxidoreductase
MTMTTSGAAAPASPLARLVETLNRVLSLAPLDLTLILARIGLAATFFLSGRTKVAEGTWLTLSDSAVFLFAEEYKLPLLPPEIAGHLALYAEHLLPILLILGLGTRYAALGLLFMTAVIQIFVYPNAYPTHATWAACCLILIAHGGGLLSLDRLLGRGNRG